MNYPDLEKIQKVASPRASYGGCLVISKSALVGYVQSKIYPGFSLALLNQSIKLYSQVCPGIKIVLGSRKCNLNPAVVPDYLDWLGEEMAKDPEFIEKLLELYRKDHLQGFQDYKSGKGFKNYKVGI
jgi:hypothetical protein